MRNISFALTTEQVRNQTKTVTRRTGWKALKVGDMLQPVVKGMGLKPGERVERIGGPIRVVAVHREFLDRLTVDTDYGFAETTREGFPDGHPKHWPSEFVKFFCDTHGCKPDEFVTRIEFVYEQAVAKDSEAQASASDSLVSDVETIKQRN